MEAAIKVRQLLLPSYTIKIFRSMHRGFIELLPYVAGRSSKESRPSRHAGTAL